MTDKIDLSLYLVTDSTPELLRGRDICTVVEDAIQGGVTIVQYRDKKSDTGVQISTAAKLHEVTKRYNVPLIINDRVDVALAVGAEGVHLGQDDMNVREAKKILPPTSIIGVSVSSIDEARDAVDGGASYLGIGTMFATPTKTNTKNIIGPVGTRQILGYLASASRAIGTVAIGGINLSNVQRVIYQSRSPKKGLDGVAIVSAIFAAEDVKAAATSFSKLVTTDPPFATTLSAERPCDTLILQKEIPGVVTKIVQAHPLCHNMINYVVANFAANVALAIGASPIMSGYGVEAGDLSTCGGSLLINMGTMTDQSMPNYLQAIKAYNSRGSAVVLDPVGAGATEVRKNAVKELMAGGYFDLIKGNEGELKQIWGKTSRQHGVDSGPTTMNNREKATMVRDLAQKERNVVLLTGNIDYLSDGARIFAIGNGHPLLGEVTGTGCALGTTLTSFLAVHKSDKLLAVLSGLLMFEIAAENAAAKEYVHGPGSFVPAFLDELWSIREQADKGSDAWLGRKAKLQYIQL
ncbi:hypothetical protein FQN54_000745 [Arachnomyces sp. PD_36]|nr:hypothetical protein FQN54_000745 [Arachnomyces sp. PD_36]